MSTAVVIGNQTPRVRRRMLWLRLAILAAATWIAGLSIQALTRIPDGAVDQVEVESFSWVEASQPVARLTARFRRGDGGVVNGAGIAPPYGIYQCITTHRLAPDHRSVLVQADFLFRSAPRRPVRVPLIGYRARSPVGLAMLAKWERRLFHHTPFWFQAPSVTHVGTAILRAPLARENNSAR